MKKIYLILFLFIGTLFAQATGSYYNPKDDQYRLLGLKRAKEIYESSKSKFDRQQELYDKRLISREQYENSKSIFADAEVNYHQALLAVLFEKQYISVVEAVKYQTDNGKKRVKITLSNSSSGGGEYKKLINVDDELFRSLQPEIINDVYISLLNDVNAIISIPYESKIEQLIHGHNVTLDFELLQDVDAVTVNMVYGSGSMRAPKIYLQKDETVNKVIFQSEQFSQEIDLGKEATFRMTLELFSQTENTFKLEVLNLPREIRRFFIDPGSNARLSQFKFNQSSQTRNAGLRIFMPDRPTEKVEMDKAIPFYVLAVPYKKAKELNLDTEKKYTEEEVKKMEVGFIKMELIPRGIGELLVKAPQLYFSAQAGETVTFPVEVINEGTRRLDNVEFDLDVPMNWQKKLNPKVIPSLDIRQEKRAELIIEIPADVTVGKYEARLRTTSRTDDKLERAEDKIISIEIQEEASVFGTLFLMLLIIGLVSLVVIYAIKLSKK